MNGLFGIAFFLLTTFGVQLPGIPQQEIAGTAHASQEMGRPEMDAPGQVQFDWSTLRRKGTRGDNWCMTWAGDDNIYTVMDDGIGFGKDESEWGSKLLRISGDEDFDVSDVQEAEGWPYTKAADSPFYAYGTYSVDGRIYSWLWKSESERGYRRPIGVRLLYTDDFGKTFYRWDGQRVTPENFSDTTPDSFFFYKVDPQWKEDRYAYALNWIAFCQNGKDNSAARDEYVYMYAVEQYDVTRLSLIRVHKKKLTDRTAYEYLQRLDGDTPVWTSNLTERGATIVYPSSWHFFWKADEVLESLRISG